MFWPSAVLGSAVAEVKSQANDAKTSVANEVNDGAMALRRASKDLRGGSAQERRLGQIAKSLADASDALPVQPLTPPAVRPATILR